MKEEVLKKIIEETVKGITKKEEKEEKEGRKKIPDLKFTNAPSEILDDAEEILKDLIKVALDDSKGLVGDPIPLEYMPYIGKVYNLYAKIKETVNMSVQHIRDQDEYIMIMMSNQNQILENQQKIYDLMMDISAKYVNQEKKQQTREIRENKKKQAEAGE